MAKKKGIVTTMGKRKKAVARAIAKPGTGKIIINGKPVGSIPNALPRMLVEEPIILAGDVSKQLDIAVNVSGGGIFGQASAVREAVAKAFVEWDGKLKKTFMEYDRTLLVSDARQTEPHKPSRSKAGPRRHKQRSKR